MLILPYDLNITFTLNKKYVFICGQVEKKLCISEKVTGQLPYDFLNDLLKK